MSKKYRNEEELRKMYCEERMTLQDIADECGVSSKNTIRNWMNKFGIETRNGSERFVNPERLKKSSVASFQIDEKGYERSSSWNPKTKSKDHVRIHQLVAIAYGADPYKIFDGKGNTVVHHDSGHPRDNRPENLVDTSQSEHVAHHNRQRIASD